MDLSKDPIIVQWRENYLSNLTNNEFTKSNVRPLIFLYNTKPYYNVPVVLVGAGPSVDKNIAILKKYQTKVIILSVDVVLFKLLENDIKPDFVVNIDPSNMFVRFWEDLDTSQLTLICPTTIHPDVLNSWKGNKLFFNQIDVKNNPKGIALERLTKPTKGYGSLMNRFFVGATALQIASLMNPRPAIFIGYDFANTDNKAYCDGFLNRKIYDDTTIEGTEHHKKNIENLTAQELVNELETKDIYGNTTSTTKKLKFYRDSFLQSIHKELKLEYVINATEGGIFIGIPQMKLEEALNQFATNEIEKKDIFNPVFKRKRRKKK